MADSGAEAIRLLHDAKKKLEDYAGKDREKQLFAFEVDDIIRRLAATRAAKDEQ